MKEMEETCRQELKVSQSVGIAIVLRNTDGWAQVFSYTAWQPVVVLIFFSLCSTQVHVHVHVWCVGRCRFKFHLGQFAFSLEKGSCVFAVHKL